MTKEILCQSVIVFNFLLGRCRIVVWKVDFPLFQIKTLGPILATFKGYIRVYMLELAMLNLRNYCFEAHEFTNLMLLLIRFLTKDFSSGANLWGVCDGDVTPVQRIGDRLLGRSENFSCLLGRLSTKAEVICNLQSYTTLLPNFSFIALVSCGISFMLYQKPELVICYASCLLFQPF